MKYIKKYIMLLLVLAITFPYITSADSGLDAGYGSSSSEGIGSLSSLVTPAFKLVASNPGDSDYGSNHIILSVICIIVFYIFTNVFAFKLNNKKKKPIIVLAINLIPTLVFSLLCLLTKLPLYIYIIVLIPYIIVFYIITKKKLKKRLQDNISLVKEKDKKFDLDKLNEEVFEVYKNIQIAWMNFDLDSIKENISEKIYEDYSKKLEKLKKDNQKNIMDSIEFKSNELVNLNIEDNVITMECKLSVTCIDYIVNNEDKVIKGKKDKKRNYTYKLIFNKKVNSNKYVLIEKKIIKQ